jgi:hypothetical protein
MRTLQITEIFQKASPTIQADALHTDDELITTPQLVKLRQYHYDLAAFMRMPEIFPIYFNQTYYDFESTRNHKIRLDMRHSYFAFYYNVLTREFKILLYLTESNNESGYGVTLDKLLANSYTVTTGDDIKALKDTQDIMFMREHLEGLYRVFKNKKIKVVMRTLHDIIDRMMLDPVSLTGQSYPSDLLHPREFFNKYYSYKQCNFPIERKFEPRTDVLNARRNFSGVNYTIVTLFNGVVGFQDFNFITTAIALVPQYKLRHRIQDWVKRTFPNK